MPVAGPERQLRLLTWGLVPSWAKDPKVGSADDQRPRGVRAGEAGLRQGGGLAVAVWSRHTAGTSGRPPRSATDAKGKPRKQPFFMHRADGASWRSRGSTSSGGTAQIADGDDPEAWLTTFTIITTRGRARARPHPRPPAAGPRTRRTGRPGSTRAHRPRTTSADCWSRTQPGRFDGLPGLRAVSSQPHNGPQLSTRCPSPSCTASSTHDRRDHRRRAT